MAGLLAGVLLRVLFYGPDHHAAEFLGDGEAALGRARRRVAIHLRMAFFIIQPDADAELRLWHALVDQPLHVLGDRRFINNAIIDDPGPVRHVVHLVHVRMDSGRRVVEHPVGNRHRQQGPRADPIQFRPKFLVDGDILVLLSSQFLPVHVDAIELILLHQCDDIRDECGPDGGICSGADEAFAGALPADAQEHLDVVPMPLGHSGLDAAIIPPHPQFTSAVGRGGGGKDAYMRVGIPRHVLGRGLGPAGPIPGHPSDLLLGLFHFFFLLAECAASAEESKCEADRNSNCEHNHYSH